MGTGRRGWMMVTKGVEILNNIKDARSLSFLDMDEDVCTQ
jgi:integrin alpha FG-GAP repeat containing protein 1